MLIKMSKDMLDIYIKIITDIRHRCQTKYFIPTRFEISISTFIPRFQDYGEIEVDININIDSEQVWIIYC